jgi:hypothetical protein
MLQPSQPDQVGKLFGAQVLVPWLDHARHIFRTRGDTSGPFHIGAVQARIPRRQCVKAKHGEQGDDRDPKGRIRDVPSDAEASTEPE